MCVLYTIRLEHFAMILWRLGKVLVVYLCFFYYLAPLQNDCLVTYVLSHMTKVTRQKSISILLSLYKGHLIPTPVCTGIQGLACIWRKNQYWSNLSKLIMYNFLKVGFQSPVFKWLGIRYGFSYSPNHWKSWCFCRDLKWFDKMAPICPDFKWLG